MKDHNDYEYIISLISDKDLHIIERLDFKSDKSAWFSSIFIIFEEINQDEFSE